MTNTIRETINTRARQISSIALSGIIALFFILSGCNSGDEGSHAASTTMQRTAKPAPVKVTSTPVNPTPASTMPVVPEVEPTEAVLKVEEKEVKPVTYADAEAAFSAKDYDKAVDLFIRYTEQKAENPWGHFMLGLSAYRMGDLDGAKAAYEQALELDRGHVKSWINLSRTYLAAGETMEALAALDKAIALDAESVDAYRLQGRAFYNMKHNTEAIAAYKQALVLDGMDVWSMNNLALIYIEEEQFDKALPVLALVVEIDNTNAVFFNNLGMVLEHHGQVTSAASAYQQALDIDSDNQKANDNLSRIQQVREQVGIEPILLPEAAAEFRSEMETWKKVETADEVTDEEVETTNEEIEK